MHNEGLFDHTKPTLRQGAEAPLSTIYCALVGRQQAPVHIPDATLDPRVQGLVQYPAISYRGVLMRTMQGHPSGTRCPCDLQRCQERPTAIPLLEAAAALRCQHLYPTEVVQYSSAA